MSKRSRKKIIPKAELPAGKFIPAVVPGENSFQFITAYDWTRATNKFWKTDNFTNALSSADDYSTKISFVIGKLIPTIYQDADKIFHSGRGTSHCHKLNSKEERIAIKIVKELHENNFGVFDDSFSWWQLGYDRGIRLVGLYSQPDNAFYPLFCDWHHLLLPSKNYNQPDTRNYKFCPGYQH
jgi:hypothetical protein